MYKNKGNAKMDNAKYAEYVNSYTDEISEYVNECFEQSKELI